MARDLSESSSIQQGIRQGVILSSFQTYINICFFIFIGYSEFLSGLF